MSYPKEIEFRTASQRAPGGGLRFLIGRPTSKASAQRMLAHRALCKRLASRGEWDVLLRVRDGHLPLEELGRLVDEHGIANYRAHLPEKAAPDAPTVAEHVRTFASLWTKSRNTLKKYEGSLRRLCRTEVGGERLGDLPWTEVARHQIQDAVAALHAEVRPNTVRTILGGWSAFFTWAVERELSESEKERREPRITVNPVRAARVWVPIQTTRHRFLRREEFFRLLEVCPPWMKAQYATLVLAGLRQAEFMHLPPQHVRLDQGVIHVGPWGDWVPKGYPRSKNGVRDVPIESTVLLPLLREYDELYAGERSFFVNPNTGHPWTASSMRARVRIDVHAAGMVYGQFEKGTNRKERTPDGVTIHTFRHTAASWLAQRDVQLTKIARIIGDTEETVRRHYLHLFPSDLERAMERMFDSEAD